MPANPLLSTGCQHLVITEDTLDKSRWTRLTHGFVSNYEQQQKVIESERNAWIPVLQDLTDREDSRYETIA